MKKGVIFAALVIFFASSVSYPFFTNTLINFTTFEQDMDKVIKMDATKHEEAIKKYPELNYEEYGFEKVQFTNEDFALNNWEIGLCPSANTIQNNVLSYCKKVVSVKVDTSSKSLSNQVLGVRIHFPQWRFLAWALVRPRYEFFAVYDDGSYVTRRAGATSRLGEVASNDNSLPVGVLVNVGQVKWIAARVYGLNYPHQLGLRIKSSDGDIQEYYMGSLWYEGWKKLMWINPYYTENLKDRVLERLPLYPKSFPYIKFNSYCIYKPEINNGGDFVTYFEYVQLAYDKAFVRGNSMNESIDDEFFWDIIGTERRTRKLNELKAISETIQLRLQEKKRQKESK